MWRTKLNPAWATAAVCALVFFLSLHILLLYKGALGLENSTHVLYYAQLAQSFLQGRLDLLGALASDVDLSAYKGRIYAYWPPLTALLMMPFVAIRGAGDFPQRLFAIVFGALNTALFYLLARRAIDAFKVRLPAWAPLAGALAFGWGSSNVTFAIVANHWYVGQLTATPFLLLALWCALERRTERRFGAAALAGLFLALAALGRQHLMLAFPAFLFFAASDESFGWQREAFSWKRVIATLLPVLLVQLVLLEYNHARFGQWLENGLGYHHMDAALRDSYARHGFFSLFYVPRNFYFMLLRPPGMERFDHQWFAMGFGLFYQSPWLLLAFRRRLRFQKPGLFWAIVASSLLAAVPIFLIMSPGYTQFGARYLFDVVPLLSLLVFLDLTPREFFAFCGLTVFSVILNALGPLAMLQGWRI